MLIGIRNTPISEKSATLDRSIDGMMGVSLGRIGYPGARRLLLALGVLILGLIAGVMYVRRVETVEVIGTLLFIPVFIALVLWGVRGGTAAALLAAGAYAAFRYPAIEAVGADRFIPLIVSRGVAYLAFGVVGGWAARQLEASLEKLELYDQVDDESGLFNAGFFVQDTDLEVSRSKRYQTIFSVALVDVPGAALEGRSRRDRGRALREVGRLLTDSVRTVDRAVHAFDGARHRIAVILPETAKEGASIFVDRLAGNLTEQLVARGAQLQDGELARKAITFPGDDGELETLREEFAAIDREQHPERAEVTAPATT